MDNYREMFKENQNSFGGDVNHSVKYTVLTIDNTCGGCNGRAIYDNCIGYHFCEKCDAVVLEMGQKMFPTQMPTGFKAFKKIAKRMENVEIEIPF